MTTEFNREDYVEITAMIGCAGNCKRYCAQEVFVKHYHGKERILTVGDFHRILHHLPRGLRISFGGWSEPFGNPDFLSFVKMAIEHDHPVAVFTTLMSATKEQVRELMTYDFWIFVVHIPDGVNFKIDLTEEYMRNFFYVLEKVRDCVVTVMNDRLVSIKREDVARHIYPKPKVVSGCRKNFFAHPNLAVLPNGNVYACYMDAEQRFCVGNLFKNDYSVIRKNFNQVDFQAMCKYCSCCLSPIQNLWRVLRKTILKPLDPKAPQNSSITGD